MSRFRTGNHWGVTIVREAGDTLRRNRTGSDECGCPIDDPRGDIRHDINQCSLSDDDELVAVVVNGDTALAERICALLNASDKVDAQCQEETWSWRHFKDEQTDGYWITCDRTDPHDEHRDEHTGLTWRTEAKP